MPDKRSHRGAHPEDEALFAPDQFPTLRGAAVDLCLLLTKSYSFTASLKLVGDHFSLTARQRMALLRTVCSDGELAHRAATCLRSDAIRDLPLYLDGFNVLTTIEAALGGALVLAGRDRCYRDIASIHGSYRKVEETVPAIMLVGQALEHLAAGPCLWLLDSPVSNSGRLKSILRNLAAENGWDWSVDLVLNPDSVLKATDGCVVTADAAILNKVTRWHNLVRHCIETSISDAWIVDLFSEPY